MSQGAAQDVGGLHSILRTPFFPIPLQGKEQRAAFSAVIFPSSSAGSLCSPRSCFPGWM